MGATCSACSSSSQGVGQPLSIAPPDTEENPAGADKAEPPVGLVSNVKNLAENKKLQAKGQEVTSRQLSAGWRGEETDDVKRTRLVQESWEIVSKDSTSVGIRFFIRIFTIAPAALKLFKFGQEGMPLESDEEFRKHAKTVIRTLGQCVAGLQDIDKLIPVLQRLGTVHAKYGVQEEHFGVVGQALLETLEEGLGSHCTPEVKEAWAQVYEIIANVMKSTLLPANAKAASAAGTARA